MQQPRLVMQYAKIVLGLPVEGPFDYLIPPYLKDKIKPGMRAWVPFRNKKLVGYIVATSPETDIKKVRPIYSIIDDVPVLDNEMLKLTKELCIYYFCCWGEAIETVLPGGLREGKKISINSQRTPSINAGSKKTTVLLQDLTGKRRWEIYWQLIKETLKAGKGIIFLSPEIELAKQAGNIIQDKLKQEVALLHSKQTRRENLSQWLKIKNNKVKIVAGTRLAVFAPLSNLGLIIVDSENDSSFKQDQSPHYHAREVAFMRSRINRCTLLLASISPSLETLYLARKNKIKYRLIKKKDFPELRIIDMRKETYSKIEKTLISFPLLEMISKALNQKKKALIFYNRKGFATFASCRNCRAVLRCPHCNVNLIYHFKEDKLICHYCNYKMQPPNICPECNASYIRYSGIGTEKLESELTRVYPAARILRFDRYQNLNLQDADIIISTKSNLKQSLKNLEFTGVVSLDNSLNRIDFRATEKTFCMLLNFIGLDIKRLVIQTHLSHHYCLQSLLNKNINLFYEEELKFRRQLQFPPFSHIVLIKLRGENQQKVEDRSQALFSSLRKANKDKAIKIISCFIPQPAKLRGKYYWQILIKSKSVKKVTHFLKKGLRDFRPSGIIVTVDVDPV